MDTLRGRVPHLSAACRHLPPGESIGMCGIYGAIGPELLPGPNRPYGVAVLDHRGPDGADVIVREIPALGRCLLGQTRLAIVDQRPIPVPFDFTASTGVLLAFNGEIYNWRELRAFFGDGTPWETDCDAEVVARAWRAYGPAMLNLFNGMWGLALLDVWSGRAFLARDRAGEKPLYLQRKGDTLHFASEVKALPGPFAEVPCPEIEALEFDCDERTPFQDILALRPGHFLDILHASEATTKCPQRWWSLPRLSPEPDRAKYLVEELTETVVDAIRIRIPDDGVPWATLLSGGLDSAIIHAVAKGERLYCATFPEIDNLTLARTAARGSDVVPVTFGIDALTEALPRIAWHLDTPATWTAVALWFLAERMAQDGVKVALSGEGADELFFGYSRYRLLWHLDRMQTDPVLEAYGPLRQYLVGRPEEILARLLCRDPEHLETARALVARFAKDPHGLVAGCARLDWHTTMQVLLRMADRMMASRSIESRAPFLDHRLITLAARLPMELKLSDAATKAGLRMVAKRLDVPAEVVWNPTKRGLALPWAAWTQADGARGPWDRKSFARAMREAWRTAFGLGVAPRSEAA